MAKLTPDRTGIELPRRMFLLSTAFAILILLECAACDALAQVKAKGGFGGAVKVEVLDNRRKITEEHFENWVFQQYRSESAARKNFLSELTLKIAELDRICSLTDEQRDKLSLAGRGDIKRFFGEYQLVKAAFKNKSQEQRNVNLVFQEIAPLQLALQAGLFHTGSLVHRSLGSVLTVQQRDMFVEAQRARRQFRHRASVELAVSLLEQAMPLNASQRETLVEILEERTRPPQRTGQHDFYSIMYQASRLPAETFESFLNEVQWHVVRQQFEQAQTMKQWLEKRGGLPRSGVEDDWL